MAFKHLQAILGEVAELAALFQADDHRLYLVGGIVRDLWLDFPVADAVDIDLTTDAHPAQTRAIVGGWADAVWLQGERFGTIGLQRDGRSIEITTHRGEVYTPDSRKPVVVFGDDVETDLSRRDFTINAMAIKLGGTVDEFELVDPFGGVRDLTSGVLRTPLDPDVSFNDDPLRVLRAARFIARFDVEPAPRLVDAAQSLVHRLDIVAIERVRDELEKLLSGPNAGVGLDFLDRTGALTRVVPELAEGDRLRRGLELAADLSTPWWLRLAGLFWPAVDGGGRARELALGLRCSASVARSIETVTASALAAQDRGEVSMADLKRWIASAGDVVTEAAALAHATGAAEFTDQVASVLATGAPVDPPLPVDGIALIDAFGLDPGPEVGRILRGLREAQFDEGPLSRDRAMVLAEALLDR